MEKYSLCPRCELNYKPIGEQYCDVCKAELGIGEAGFLLPDDDEESEARLCPICHTNYCEEGEDMCIECKKELNAKSKSDDSETDDWMDSEEATEIEEDEMLIPEGLSDEEEEEEPTESYSDDDFEYINTDDFADDEDDEEEDEGDYN